MQLIPGQDSFFDLGVHRVIEPKGALPQPAWKLDNTPIARPSETLVDIHTLHIDSASFTQIANACDHDPTRIKKHILDIVAQRGKMHNPVTGSGGVLVGSIQVLDEVSGKTHGLAIGDTIVSLTSLSWLPLYLEDISAIHLDRCEVEARGKAIFFRGNPVSKLPGDLPQSIVVAALDVAGAPSRVSALVNPGMCVTVLGAGGTAGLLTLCAIRQKIGRNGKIVAIEYDEKALWDIEALKVADVLVQGDATYPLRLVEQVRAACGKSDYQANLAVNVVNVPNTEFATILLTRADGRILFFSMATSFTVAALGAEGMARQVEMHIGNGYMPDHGAVALQLLRAYPGLREIFMKRFG
ncbi:MAG TPA: L-erythro-3,5-diaminohexanoate dehydrogenase [Ktedonobacteraceae bacterium]|jgi:L-erythro-3,5-diaminohexanoate dehydrogenase|nr:L-erythro-3,5-diaminohexanoate dehydrogenase [Ktedonobacteraceae bacterium]